jgi:hypothetical protein
MLARTTSEHWEGKMKKSISDKLITLRDEYILKIQEIIQERRKRVEKMFKISEGAAERNETENSLIDLATGFSLELLNKEVHRKISVNAQLKDVFRRLRDLGFVHPIKNKSISNSQLHYLNDDEIVKKYNSIIFGLLN